MRIINFLSIMLMLFLLQACLPTMQIEKSGIINTRGVDLIEEDEEMMIETTIIPYLFDPSAQNISAVLVGKGNTIKQARDNAGKQSSFKLAPGQIRLELYGKAAAESGILTFLNTLVRDARVSDTMQLAVTNQTAREILENEQTTIKINTSQYLQDLMKKDIERNTLPDNSLHTFTRVVEEIGVDPILPIIDIVGNKPTLVGAALFHRDRYVQRINLSEAFLINMLLNRVKETPLDVAVPLDHYQDQIVPLPPEEEAELEDEEFLYIFLSLFKGDSKIKLVDENRLHYTANIKMEVELLESSLPIDIRTEELSNQFERDFELFYKTKYENLFSKLLEANSDAFGLGRIYRTTRKGSKTTNEEWTEMYPNVTMDFHVDVDILNYGTIG